MARSVQNQNTYYGDEMSKLLANNKAEPVSADVINRIPSSNVVGGDGL